MGCSDDHATALLIATVPSASPEQVEAGVGAARKRRGAGEIERKQWWYPYREYGGGG